MVSDLPTALEAYWGAKSHREMQAAYHEILLFGGVDGYPDCELWRRWVVRMLRRIALWLEKR